MKAYLTSDKFANNVLPMLVIVVSVAHFFL